MTTYPQQEEYFGKLTDTELILKTLRDCRETIRVLSAPGDHAGYFWVKDLVIDLTLYTEERLQK